MTSTETSKELIALRDLSDDDHPRAQRKAWEWLITLTGTELAAVFDLSAAPSALPSGDTDGTVVAFTVAPRVDGLLSAAFATFLPWQGKRFRPSPSAGIVLFQRRARLSLRAIMPRYPIDTADGKVAAMEFRSRFEPSVAGRGRARLLALDYDLDVNPRLLRGLREEVVEVVDGVYLGRMMLSPIRFPWRPVLKGRWAAVGFFVLR